MSGADLKRMETMQFPNAHLGHLSEAQQSALDSFKELCEKEGFYKPKGKDGAAEASHDDETLLRYLRARRFVPQDAFIQFKDTEEWRKENRLDELYEKIDVREYDETRRLYPQWTGRRDKRGIPVYVFEVAHLNSKTMAAYDKSISKSPAPIVQNKSQVSSKLLRLFALYENLCRFAMPLCSAVRDRQHPETPITQSNNIVDISKVGLKQFWNLKNHMQDASQLATAHYPETLDRIFIIGAPAFFPTVWGWIKRWFDPITVSKIFILSSTDMLPTLERYIDRANIPKKYGGELEFEFGQLPAPEPAIANFVQWDEGAAVQSGQKTFPVGPIKWVEDATGWKAVATGTENGVQRQKVVCRLPPGASVKTTVLDGTLPLNTPLTELELSQVETGYATQPPDTGDEVEEEQPPSSGESTPAPGSIQSPTKSSTPAPSEAATADTSIASAISAMAATSISANMDKPDHVPASAHNHPDSHTAPPPDARTGTSSTRFEDQKPTHASGQLAEGTPAVVHHGDGDKTQTMEPGTVGQAPKDVSKPIADRSGDFDNSSYLDTAKNAANAVAGTVANAGSAVAGAVGLGGKKEDTETKSEDVGGQDKKDERVEGASNAKVEGFLRSQVGSDPSAAPAK